MAKFSVLLGKTITEIVGGAVGDDEIVFRTADNGHYRMFHSQDCCETVSINDIEGDMQSLIGSPILVAEEASNRDEPKPSKDYESFTWTFYKLATIKGHVDIRWLGESNGYYAEDVSFKDMNDPKDYGH